MAGDFFSRPAFSGPVSGPFSGLAADLDVAALAAELRELKSLLLAAASEPGQLHVVAELDSARRCAETADMAAMLTHLKAAGPWPLAVAADFGMSAAAAALRAALDLPG